jgi:hypothetical protein
MDMSPVPLTFAGVFEVVCVLVLGAVAAAFEREQSRRQQQVEWPSAILDSLCPDLSFGDQVVQLLLLKLDIDSRPARMIAIDTVPLGIPYRSLLAWPESPPDGRVEMFARLVLQARVPEYQRDQPSPDDQGEARSVAGRSRHVAIVRTRDSVYHELGKMVVAYRRCRGQPHQLTQFYAHRPSPILPTKMVP